MAGISVCLLCVVRSGTSVVVASTSTGMAMTVMVAVVLLVGAGVGIVPSASPSVRGSVNVGPSYIAGAVGLLASLNALA